MFEQKNGTGEGSPVQANSERPPPVVSEVRSGRARKQPIRIGISGALFSVPVVAYLLWSCEPSPKSIAASLEQQKKEGHWPAEMRPLVPVQSGSILGHVVIDNKVDLSAPCYRSLNVQRSKSLERLEIRYEDSGTLKNELAALGAGFVSGTISEGKETRVVLENLSIASTTGVYDPLSKCSAGKHQVVTWEVRAERAVLDSTRSNANEIETKIALDSGSGQATTKLTREKKSKLLGTNVVVAYQTSLVETTVTAQTTLWTGPVAANDSVNLPEGAPSGLKLKVVSFDRRRNPAFELRMSAPRSVTTRCERIHQSPAASDFALGLGESCAIDIGDAVGLFVETGVKSGKVEVNVSMFQTKQGAASEAAGPDNR